MPDPDSPSSAPAPASEIDETRIPIATIRPRRGGPRVWLPWLVPAIALLVTAVLIVQTLAARGPRITLRFQNGHGIESNDPVVYAGVQIGRIQSVGIDPSTRQILIRAELNRDSSFLANSGRFWIVRPEVSLSRVAGLDTLIGPRYIAADFPSPSQSKSVPQSLEAPPVLHDLPGLNILIRAARAASISIGAPVSYRDLPVGSVTDTHLAPDARTVIISVNILPGHEHLVRSHSRFWNVSGIGLDLGLVGGLKLKAESLQTIFAGGLAFATPEKPPPQSGEFITDGTEFQMVEYDDEFLKWAPDLTTPGP